MSRVFAQIASDLFRLTHETSVNVHQELVTSLCEGWSIVPREPKDEAEWADMAAEFEHALTRKSNVAVDVTTKELLKSAFYNGVKHALADRMAAHKTSRLLQIQKRAKNVVSIAINGDRSYRSTDSLTGPRFASANAKR